MKKTTVIALAFLSVVLLMSLLFPAIAEALGTRNGREIFVDSLTMHRSAPITRIVGVDEDSIMRRYGLEVDVEVVFTDREEECGIAYPANVISLKQQGGVVTFKISDEFTRKGDEGWQIMTYKVRQEAAHPVCGTAYEGAEAAEPVVTDEDTFSPDTVLVRHPDGTVRKQAAMSDGGYGTHIRILVKTTSQLAGADLGRSQNLHLGTCRLPALQVSHFGDIGFHGRCHIGRLEVRGTGPVDWGNAVIDNIAFTRTPPPSGSDYIDNRFSYDSECLLGTITIAGEGTVENLDAGKFRHITLMPQGGDGLDVTVRASKEVVRVK